MDSSGLQSSPGKGTAEDSRSERRPGRRRILYLVHRIPYPPNKGDKIRSYHLLVNLARHHEVDLVTHADDPRDLKHRQILADMCRSVDIFPINPLVGRLHALAALPSRTPLSVAYLTRRAARRRIERLMAERDYDAVFLLSSQMGAYLPEEGLPPMLVDLVDVDSQKWADYGRQKGFFRGFIDRLEARRLRGFERALATRARHVVVTTPQEARILKASVLDRPVESVTNGALAPDTVVPADRREAGLMIYVGTMDYPPNVQAAIFAAREVLPLVRQQLPDARLRIVGRSPTREVRALEKIDGVEVTGEVPDMEVHLNAASVALLPLQVARGVQTKVIEAFAYGIPVVASRRVAVCLEEGSERALRVGEAPEELAEHAVDLLRDEEARQRLSDAGRAYVREAHHWQSLDTRWQRLINDVLGARDAATPGEGA